MYLPYVRPKAILPIVLMAVLGQSFELVPLVPVRNASPLGVLFYHRRSILDGSPMDLFDLQVLLSVDLLSCGVLLQLQPRLRQ